MHAIDEFSFAAMENKQPPLEACLLLVPPPAWRRQGVSPSGDPQLGGGETGIERRSPRQRHGWHVKPCALLQQRRADVEFPPAEQQLPVAASPWNGRLAALLRKVARIARRFGGLPGRHA